MSKQADETLDPNSGWTVSLSGVWSQTIPTECKVPVQEVEPVITLVTANILPSLAEDAIPVNQPEEVYPVLKLNVNYHYAHAIRCGFEAVSVEAIDLQNGIIKLTGNPLNREGNHFVKFSRTGIQTIFNKNKDNIFYQEQNQDTPNNLHLDLDTYSGTVAIRYAVLRTISTGMHSSRTLNDDPFIYNEKIGYSSRVEKCLHGGRTDAYSPPVYEWITTYKPVDDFGYIMESPLRMTLRLLKELAVVENLQQGVMKFRTSSFDINGYAVQLFPEAIIDITQSVDKDKMTILDSNRWLRSQLKEALEQKEEAPLLPKSNELGLGSLSLDADASIGSQVVNLLDSVVELLGEQSNETCIHL